MPWRFGVHPLFNGLSEPSTVTCVYARRRTCGGSDMFDRYLVRLGITSALTGILALIAMAKSPAVRTISPAGGGDAFLAHVSTDKPIYRAGERVYVRGVVLNANDHKPLP